MKHVLSECRYRQGLPPWAFLTSFDISTCCTCVRLMIDAKTGMTYGSSCRHMRGWLWANFALWMRPLPRSVCRCLCKS